MNTDYIFQVDTDNQFFASDFKNFGIVENFDLIIGFRKQRFDDNIRLVITKIWRFLILIIFDLTSKMLTFS